MNIGEMIKQNILDIESQLNVDLSAKSLKPVVFIDNTNFATDENPLAIVHLDLFNAKDVVPLKSKMNSNDAFTITNLVGDDSVYCLWGNENKDVIYNSLEEWGYPISNKTVFFDLRAAASNFYNREINNFEDIQNIVSYSSDSLELIFSSKESIMYSLFLDMLNSGYSEATFTKNIENLIMENELIIADNLYKGQEFRAGKSNIEFEREELANLELFVDNMAQYNDEIEAYLNAKVTQAGMSDVHRMLLSEKATMCRMKRDVYRYTKSLIQTYKKEDFETFKFYYKTMDMYLLIEDAFILGEWIKNENTPFAAFVSDLGASFALSTATYAQTYMLRKNVLAKLNNVK